MKSAQLTDRAVIALEGGEARGFLQGLITNDIAQLEPAKGLYAALLTPQGKLLFDFFIIEGDGALLLDCARASAEALARKLSLYRLRAKVGIELKSRLAVYASLDGRAATRAITFPDPRGVGLPPRSIGASAEMPEILEGPAVYHAQRFGLGIPEGADFGSDKVFALDAGLEELRGVSFSKGCYVGQELTARMKHRGTAKKRILPVRTDGPALRSGVKVMRGTGELGEILSVQGSQGFALIRLDRLEDSKGTLTVENVPVALGPAPWFSP